MLRKSIVVAAALALISTPSAFSHDGHHHEPPVVPPVVEPAGPVFVPPPVVELPPPVVQPPVVQAQPSVPVTLQLPIISPPNTILPTDVTGFRANMVERNPHEEPLSKEQLSALLAKDPRFAFTGNWILFSSNYSASSDHLAPVSYVPSEANAFKIGRIEKTIKSRTKFSEPAFMPTETAHYVKVDDDHLDLKQGAVLVRAGDRPVYVSTKLCDEQVTTQISGKSIALVSAFDEKPTVLNLTDDSCGSVSITVPSATPPKTHVIAMKAGQIAEAYKLDSKPTSNLVATKIEINERIGPHCGLLVSQCHYVRALKKFNLVAALHKDDLNRVIKTAAAVQYVRRNR